VTKQISPKFFSRTGRGETLNEIILKRLATTINWFNINLDKVNETAVCSANVCKKIWEHSWLQKEAGSP